MAKNQLALSPQAAMYLSQRYDMQPHPLLRVGDAHPDADEDAATRIADAGRAELKRQGLIDTDEVSPFLDDAWNLLAHPPMALGLAVRRDKSTPFNAVLVEQGRSTIQAHQDDGETGDELSDIVLSKHDLGGLAGNAVNLLGPITAATGGSASLPTEYIHAVGKRMEANPSGSIRTALTSSGIRHADVDVLNNAFSAQRTMTCVFTARAYDRLVRRMHTLPVNLSVFTTGEGTYTAQNKSGGDGRQWYTVAPADGRKISQEINAMIKALSAPNR